MNIPHRRSKGEWRQPEGCSQRPSKLSTKAATYAYFLQVRLASFLANHSSWIHRAVHLRHAPNLRVPLSY
eukprot:328826-Pyramimonas_sp.AAC.1